MNWEAIGTVGEIIGAAAVVVSLIYLAAQIRHNTSQLDEQNRSNRITSLTAVGDNFFRFRAQINSNTELASIWKKGGQSLDSLDEEERLRFDLLAVDVFWAWAMMWLYAQEDVVEENLVDISMSNLWLYAKPGVRKWWAESEHRTEYPPEFAKAIDELFRSGSQNA